MKFNFSSQDIFFLFVHFKVQKAKSAKLSLLLNESVKVITGVTSWLQAAVRSDIEQLMAACNCSN